MKASSPASRGPAGSLFEAQVGAYYLLCMLAGSDSRGLPGTTIDRMQFQRAAEGRPLDDVIVQAHERVSGSPAVMEIQVKRTITFTPNDREFRSVVGQIVEATRRPDFWSSRYQIAIAVARTSGKIERSYQDVLTWARQLGDSATFLSRIDRRGSSNQAMRDFVHTFESHLQAFGVADDPNLVWRLLARMLILVFDFTAQGSACEELVKDRALSVLHADESMRAGNLWTTLIGLALQVAASGGERTRDTLIDEIRARSFRLAGERRYATARKAITEASQYALSDITDKVGGVVIGRHERVAAVRASLDRGRYLEIRGDAGVGKSVVLKYFAVQLGAEAPVVVLSPGRAVPKGWFAMRSVLGFDGTAPELLSDLALDGGSALLLDGLDFFDDEERKTVIDLVRAASRIPGFAVIATARRDFGVAEANWLPPDVLDNLGRTEPVVIEELSDEEAEELRRTTPQLAPLLADAHPARGMTRNLFRLARLVSLPQNEQNQRTEVDMARHWWQTADGRIDPGHRERSRLLRALAERALAGAETVDVMDHPAAAVNVLVASETLRDLGGDRVAFRHDVLREWAVSCLLDSDPRYLDSLALAKPAPPALARAVELMARMTVERAGDSASWEALLARLSRADSHGSWRRAVLLALVRSEMGEELLGRASSFLLAEKASVLRELIRVVKAVEVQPASKVFAGVGVDPAMIPAGTYFPSGASWMRLVRWLLSLGESLPAAAIPDVVGISTAWSVGTIGLDPLTPSLLRMLFRWLNEIEMANQAVTFHDRREPFGGEFNHEQLRALESDLRTGFLLFCNRTPDLAAEYMRSLGQSRHSEDTIRSILRFRGSLALAAPAELADLTANTLIWVPDPNDRLHGIEFRGPFGYADHEFLPASPAQGPFLELLIHAPKHGLSLVHRLVAHAASYYWQGDPGADAITVPLPQGERTFPWKRSYYWSREGAGSYCLASALMALEAWGHKRIEGGEDVQLVLADMMAPPDSCAAYLLVVVDLLLSHWPSSMEAVVPYLASPELLCVDRERQVYDGLEYPDYFGLRALQKEPVGLASVESLKKRPSRRFMLDWLLGDIALGESAQLRERLTALLRQAAMRLGPPDERSTLGDPRLMAVYALNVLDPNNWHEEPVVLPDGTRSSVFRYQPPQAEAQHFAALQTAAQASMAETNMQSALGLALEDPSRCSPEFVAEAIAWAQTPAATEQSTDEDAKWMRDQAVVSAAMIAMRDGGPETRARRAEWARRIFAEALAAKEDAVHRFRTGLRHNPIAISFVGMVHALKQRSDTTDIRALLEVAAREDPAAAHGFGQAVVVLASIDERLVRSILRCALAACVRPSREWDLSEEKVAARSERQQQRAEAVLQDELAWLANERPEPAWPAFPLPVPRPRRGFYLPWGSEKDRGVREKRVAPEAFIDHQAAALWLTKATSVIDETMRSWFTDIVRVYASWTVAANGAGLSPGEEAENRPFEWNEAYFDLLARCLPGLAFSEIDQLALSLIASLPDQAFFDVVARFQRSVDDVYFNNLGLDEATAIRIRSSLAARLMQSSGWRRHAVAKDASIETHIGPAIAVLFFNDYGLIQPAKCYLSPKAVERVDSFIPVLSELVQSGPSLFVAMVTLNLVEVSPRTAHLTFVVTAARRWLESRPEATDFWVDCGVGHRVCGLIEAIHRQAPSVLQGDRDVRIEVDQLLSALVSLGVADARRLEEVIAMGSE